MTELLNASEAKKLSEKARDSFPSEDVRKLASQTIKRSAERGYHKAAFPCPREEAPYLKQQLELLGYFVLVYADVDRAPVYGVEVYWNELSFLNSKAIYRKEFPFLMYTLRGAEAYQPYLPNFLKDNPQPKEDINVAKLVPFPHDHGLDRTPKRDPS